MLERIRCRFFLGVKKDSKRIYWVKWRSTHAIYEQGSLDIGSIYAKNLSVIGKWQWLFHTEKEALWHTVISQLYGSECELYGGRGPGLKTSVQEKYKEYRGCN